jgi:hypothetical protein
MFICSALSAQSFELVFYFSFFDTVTNVFILFLGFNNDIVTIDGRESAGTGRERKREDNDGGMFFIPFFIYSTNDYLQVLRVQQQPRHSPPLPSLSLPLPLPPTAHKKGPNDVLLSFGR